MNKNTRFLLAAALALLALTGCGGGDAQEPLPGGPGPATPPRQELHYGDVVYLKSDSSQWYLSVARHGWFGRVAAAEAPGTATEWQVIDPHHQDAVGPVRFGDAVRFRSTGGAYVSGLFGELQLESGLPLSDTWTLTSERGAAAGEPVKFNEAVRIQASGAGRYLSGSARPSPTGEPAVGLRSAAGAASATLSWRVAPRGSLRNSTWMTEIASALRDVPLTQAVIPGSHDAGTYSITENSAVSPDLPVDDVLYRMLRDSALLSSRVNPYLARFARAQTMDIGQQLHAGVRYFDLRAGGVGQGEGADALVVHSLYGGSLLPMLDAVEQFLATRPQEVVILDFSHFTAMGEDHHRRLIDHIKQTFGPRLAPAIPGASADDPQANAYTFGRMWEQGWQVVALYHDPHADAEPLLWRYGTPENSTFWWPDEPTTQQVKAVLDGQLANERRALSPGVLYVLQTVLTGDAALYQKVVLKLEATVLLQEARKKLVPFQDAVNSAQSKVNGISKSIKSKKDQIDDYEDWIEDNWWNVPGVTWREAKVLELKGEVKLLEVAKKGADSALSAARSKLAEASKSLASLEKTVNDPAVPTSLAELAAAGNPEMLRWLDEWRGRGLNIVIRDLADQAFVDKVRALNLAR